MRARSQGKLLTRMIATSCIYVLVMVAVLSALLVNMDVSTERTSTQNVLAQLSDKSSDQLEKLISDMEKLTYSLATSSEVIAAMKQANDAAGTDNFFDKTPGKKRELIRLMQMLSGADVGKRSLSLVSDMGDSVNLSTYGTPILSRQAIADMGRLAMLEGLPLGKCLLPVSPDPYGRTEERMFAFVRTIADAYHSYGCVEVQDSIETLNEIFDNAMESFPTTTVIFHGDELFYTSDHDKTRWEGMSAALRAEGQESAVTEVKVNGESAFLYTVRIARQNLTLYAFVSMEYYFGHIRDKVAVIGLIALAFLLVMILSTVMVNNHLYRPIRDLRDRMTQMKYDGSPVTLHVAGENDELALFNQAFSNMLDNISRQNDELMARRMRELEISYRVLQSQVSPHFLHNTLSVIGFKGEMLGSPEIMEMCSCLSRMMTYSINTGEGSVPFAQEVKYMDEYLRLMKYRFLERLQYEVNLSPALDEIIVPKFILQPIVENCFTHGFRNAVVPTYIIHIGGEVTAKGWVIRVEDNGSGFSPEDQARVLGEMAHIRESIASSGAPVHHNTTAGIGLINTYARLVLGLRETGEVSLDIARSALGGGAVTITYTEGGGDRHAAADDRGGGRNGHPARLDGDDRPDEAAP